MNLLHTVTDRYILLVNPQERKPQAPRDWLDLLQGRAHNVHEVDVCAYSFALRLRINPTGGMAMELRVLKYFLAVARHQNITRAAEELHLTQPTLSR